ncbi:MarR family winged helix-turn-helix transcriptional regulator [Azohydromonas sediminis]|uniref:MarR family winged helix-turn-helix transcriptional regulator n=1 Tax=Azohydromonas sediminis TaxID=2259674 RepID=UPI000E652F55|nr:MarR family winged helix-turn-helix transcriptional regulator [Azohydromonas sediminis]
MRPFLDDHLVYLLARASHALWRGFEPRVRDAGLSSLEWRVMAVLADREPLPVGTLAREVLAKQPTLTKALDRMAQQGWIERRADPDDARRARVALTRAGRERVAPLLAAAAAHEARQFAGVPAAERKRLQRQLRAIIDRFDADEPPS